MCLIHNNNLRVFLKFRLLLWSSFNLQMYTHRYKFKPFSILSNLEQLSAAVLGKQHELRDMYIYLKRLDLPFLCNFDPGLLFKIFSTLTLFHHIKTENNSILA